MHIGIPKETAFQENRIALMPEAVGVLVNNGHHVVIEHNAGEATHYTDKEYSEAGAKIVYRKSEVYKAPLLVKSAPVVEEDLPLLQQNQTIISPIHFSAIKTELLEKMMEKRITAISFENLKDDSGTYPIVRSMSEIAGSAVMLIAGQYLGLPIRKRCFARRYLRNTTYKSYYYRRRYCWRICSTARWHLVHL